jgi:long-chain acyl-CoA synthetase
MKYEYAVNLRGIAVFGLIDETTPGAMKTIADIYNTGFKRSKNQPMVGHRPVTSTNPLKFADHYVWETYAQFDVRRRAVGSALHGMFASGELKSDGLETVGIWSMNRPGALNQHHAIMTSA